MEFAKVIINIIIKHHRFLDLIVIDKNSLFTPKFWLLLCYFLNLKSKLFTTFLLEIKNENQK